MCSLGIQWHLFLLVTVWAPFMALGLWVSSKIAGPDYLDRHRSAYGGFAFIAVSAVWAYAHASAIVGLCRAMGYS